jgi:type III restriction enzyme
LLRNEEVYKIYDFDKGRGFYPDFLLFLKDKNQSNMQYQIFIEPKGNEFLGEDNTFKGGKEGWKEIFLEQISAKYGNNEILKAENKKYKLIGLPFFNKDHNNAFKAKYQEIVE